MIKLKSKLIVAVLVIFGTTAFLSCEKETTISKNEITEECFVNENEAIIYASDLLFHQVNGNKSTKASKKVNSAVPVPDENGEPVFYVINYENGGFIVISADKRINPIMAFSETGTFSLDEGGVPVGIVDWLWDSKEKVKEARTSKTVDQKMLQTWEPCAMQKVIYPEDDPCGDDPGNGGCQDTHYEKGPLLTTAWGQGYGYNNLLPNLSCNNANGRAVTGCVATAMAQVMKYHEYPANYNWTGMPNTYGTNSTAILMKDIGTAVGMNYGCGENGGSSADDGNIAPALINTFGYASASRSGFDREVLKQQLRWNRPVILVGYATKSTSWFGLVTEYSDGHAWVCDGYMSHFYCEIGVGTLYLHMNWGWSNYSDSDTRPNGWFAYNNWDSGKYAFNYEKRMIYNIKPN